MKQHAHALGLGIAIAVGAMACIGLLKPAGEAPRLRHSIPDLHLEDFTHSMDFSLEEADLGEELDDLVEFGQPIIRRARRFGRGDWPFPTDLVFLTSPYGERMHPIYGEMRWHAGIDLAGTVARAVKDSVVEFVGAHGPYGNMIVLVHKDGRAKTRYGHLARMDVYQGEEIEVGRIIGLIGSTGISTGPHLHFEVLVLNRKGKWVPRDPKKFLY